MPVAESSKNQEPATATTRRTDHGQRFAVNRHRHRFFFAPFFATTSKSYSAAMSSPRLRTPYNAAPMTLPYRDFAYPLNVFMHILTREEGDVRYLHYALFGSERESIATAQERSTDLLLARLPPPPARILEAGIGLGTTLDRLTRAGYDATGITPDDHQIAMVRNRYGPALHVECAAFEHYVPDRPFDAVVFQESSQYIESEALFARAELLASRVLVLDEFALRPLAAPGALHSLDDFLAAAGRHRFRKIEEIDLSAQAAPTIDYFMQRIPRHRDALKQDLGLTDQQVDELIESGQTYRSQYRDGTYGYRLLQFER